MNAVQEIKARNDEREWADIEAILRAIQPALKKNVERRREVEAKVKQLYAQGYSDPSIAQAVAVTRTVIRYWRLRNDLPPNAHGGRPRKVVEK